MDEDGQLHASATLIPGKEPPNAYCIRSEVGPRASLNAMEKRKMSYPCHELSLDSLVA
jgi:hypothetical protein